MSVRAALGLVPLVLAATFVSSLAAVSFAAPSSADTGAILRETGDLLVWQAGPFGFRDELAKTGLAVELMSILAVLAIAYLVFRPLAAPRDLPDAELRHAAAQIVKQHGNDTLSFFKLRADKHYLFDPSRLAVVGYRVENGVLMISGDPVGEPAAVADLMRTVVAFAAARSLQIGAVGVSPAGRDLLEQAGLRALYIGDEAIVDTDGFSLEGRGIRKVRQSVARMEKAGYRYDWPSSGRSTSARWPSSSRWPRTGGGGRPSAASAWRWTRCATRIAPRRSSSVPRTRTARSTASCSSSPPTAARPSRSPSCGGGPTRRTG